MKRETFIFWNGVILFLYVGFLLGLLAHRERVWREYERQSKLYSIHYGK